MTWKTNSRQQFRFMDTSWLTAVLVGSSCLLFFENPIVHARPIVTACLFVYQFIRYLFSVELCAKPTETNSFCPSNCNEQSRQTNENLLEDLKNDFRTAKILLSKVSEINEGLISQR